MTADPTESRDSGQDPGTEVKVTVRYRKGLPIAQGGMGLVLEAEDLHLSRSVAMKVLLPSLASSLSSTERFQREIRILARLEHPHIIPIHESGLDADGRPFYTMKRVQGRTL